MKREKTYIEHSGILNKFLRISLITLYVISIPMTLSGQKKAKDVQGAFATGKYRNLFIENGHSKKDIAAKNEDAFRQLFHGDSANQKIRTGRWLMFVMYCITTSAAKGSHME
jgi:hypothetical protein